MTYAYVQADRKNARMHWVHLPEIPMAHEPQLVCGQDWDFDRTMWEYLEQDDMLIYLEDEGCPKCLAKFRKAVGL